MLQDIYPAKMDNSFKNVIITDEDFVIVFNSEGKVLAGENAGKIRFLLAKEINDTSKAIYLFSIDDERFFLLYDGIDDDKKGLVLNDRVYEGEKRLLLKDEIDKKIKSGFEYSTIRELRNKYYGKELFAAFTAFHLWKWYSDNVFCGKCGSRLSLDQKERALRCDHCGNIIYPRINPAVIVGVIKGDCLLITRYRKGYAHNALVAGFTEIGETFEETVEREVMEETGVKVKNIKYYKSQPWGMAQDILAGFFCEVDGESKIHMDDNELKYAEWVKREDIELQPVDHSLTNEMMKVFKRGEVCI